MRWRCTAGAALVCLVVWPTIAAPVHGLRLALENGVELTKAGPSLIAPGIAAYIRNHTAIDARVFSPHFREMNYATGRPNASGFAGLVHLNPSQGPQFRDVIGYLEPAAVRRLSFDYIHAPDSWVDGLPDDAADRLNDPRLFEHLVRDRSESLYRVLPVFLSLDTPPAPGSYEALRQAVPPSATVLLPEIFQSRPVNRTAWALSHARLFGVVGRQELNLRTQWQIAPLGDRIPDLIIAPLRFVAWMLPANSRQPIWWNDETAVYSLNGAVDQIIAPPPWTEPLPFGIHVSDVSEADGRIAFTATFDDRSPDQWSGQDWIVFATDNSPLGLPTQILADGRTPATHIWFSGQLGPGRETSSVDYELDFLKPGMAFRAGDGAWTPAGVSEAESGPGSYTLAVRLRHEYKPNQWRDAAIIPVLNITISETGQVSYQVYQDVRA